MTTSSQSCYLGHEIFQQSCKHCRTFKADWDDQLKINGFKDIETDIHETMPHIISRHVELHTSETYHARANYFQWARGKTEDARFKSQLDYMLWSRYADGETHLEIAKWARISQPWVTRKLKKIEEYLVTGSISQLKPQLQLTGIDLA